MTGCSWGGELAVAVEAKRLGATRNDVARQTLTYPGETLIDPACGTGGFLITMLQHIVNRSPAMAREQRDHLRYQALHGVDIVPSVVRLCAMNLLLHNVGPSASQLADRRRELTDEGLKADQVQAQLDTLLPISTNDALRQLGSERYDLAATNPPFGRKSSIKVIGEAGQIDTDEISYERDDFWATTSNKQLNFLQHIRSLLKINGRAAVVLPDNVLFEGGAGSPKAATRSSGSTTCAAPSSRWRRSWEICCPPEGSRPPAAWC